jgi:hypothetical protein
MDVFRRARRTEEDFSVRQVDRLDVRDVRGRGELPQVVAVGVDLVQMIIILGVAAQREEDAPSVEIHDRIAGDALRHV